MLFRSTYKDIVKPERLVYLHDSDDDAPDDPHWFVTTVTFDNEGGRTRLTMRARLQTPEEREAVVAFGAVEGAKQTLGRLAEYLSHE